MNGIHQLAKKLSELIALEGENTREEIAGYIVGELVGDYDGTYKELQEKYPDLERIADLASDLEWSNGSTEQLQEMWKELKRLVQGL